MKDWTGNGNSIFKTLGASNHTEKQREENDFYATDPIAIDLLKKKINLPHNILEPACGNGSLSERLIQLGHNVTSSDIINRNYGTQKCFFSYNYSPLNTPFAIVTNPPYKFATQFVLHGLNILPKDNLLCLFLKTTFAEGQQRYNQIFSKFPPYIILQCSKRVLCAKNADFDYMKKAGGSAVSYAWWIWKKDFKGNTTFDWI